ncbi:hypothetical protein ACFVZH_20720 [Streptomyces sp. NPDC059534]|uniref:hypothetical protein n=1 Tax=Streptomyces sp. NPDC059534 TaxID=3346859 RepID=UPI0036C5613B
MPIAKVDHPVFKLTCDTCELDAEHDGLTAYFTSRDSAASYARDFDWDGPWCLNPDIPIHCPDCAAQQREQKARAQSDQEHHEAEIAAAVRYALDTP